MTVARDAARVALIEATCNQVNHRGGYTGQTPADFAAATIRLAQRVGLPRERLLLGGDHLGPGPWQRRPADEAMAEARLLVAAYAAAGYAKLHLDPSMPLGGDPDPLPLELIAGRTAELAAVAEAARPDNVPPPVFVIGSEVPIAGGARGATHTIAVTRPADVAATLDATRRVFEERGLDVWERVIAVVVQPGVEFGDDAVIDYDRPAAAELARFIETQPGLVYEAHSTDYQKPESLRELVEDGFAILKVGPALTFAYREAIFSLEAIEREWLGGRRGVALSGVRAALEAAMVARPEYWKGYYGGDEREQALKRAFSYSDRARYYWTEAGVVAAVGRLFGNLGGRALPGTLVSQYLPRQYELVRAGAMEPEPQAVVGVAVAAALEPYMTATSH